MNVVISVLGNDIKPVLEYSGLKVTRTVHLSRSIDVYGTPLVDFKDLQQHFYRVSEELKVDIGVQLDTIDRSHKRLVVFDMDSTLIQQEVIDELARELGVYDQIAPITESAMRGEIDFDESLKRRVGLLTGAPASIIETVKSRIQFTEGALETCQQLKRLGVKLAVVSGGFMPLALHVKQTLGLDYAFANTLEEKDGYLTGNVLGKIVNAQRKADLLTVMAQVERADLSQVLAVGDGANDLLMMKECLGIAYNAKPKVQQQADLRINRPSLLYVLSYLGVN
ncbi:HAD-like domain-containing protein, partial [Gorgonomyces haynaldii]